VPTVKDDADRGVITARDEGYSCSDDFFEGLGGTLLLLDNTREATKGNGKLIVAV